MNEEKIDVNGLDEDLVVLTTDDGVEHNFYHVATVDYKNEWYVFFQPAEEIPDIDEDEVVIFRLEEDENGDKIEKERPILDENGNPEYIYSLRYEEFIALNTAMIQKLWQRVDDIEKENAEMRHQIKSLQQDIAELKKIRA